MSSHSASSTDAYLPYWQSLASATVARAAATPPPPDTQTKSMAALLQWWDAASTEVSRRSIDIEQIKYDGKEYITLVNRGPLVVKLNGWRINAGSEGQDFTFPDNTLLPPNGSVMVYTEPGHEYSFNSRVNVWNDRGDTAFLYDGQGELACSLAYGDKVRKVSIEAIQYDGIEGRGEADEYVEIANLGEHAADLSNWRVNAGPNQDFYFPIGSYLAAGEALRVYTNTYDPSTGGYSFQSHRALWNNKGDTGRLFNQAGELVSELAYGNQA